MSTHFGTLTRVIAVDALSLVLQRQKHTDEALAKLFSLHPQLRPLDKAFIYEMVFGSLRWLSKMDWIMSHMVDRPFSTLDPRVANALRIGVYQIYYMDKVPARAAVSETVEAIKKVGVASAASLVNAILRRVAAKADYFAKPDKNKEVVDYYAMHYAHPKWMIERWMRHLSPEKMEFLMASHNKPPLQTLKVISANPLPEGATNLSEYLLKTQSLESSWRALPGALRLERLPRFESCEAYKKGCYIVQDEAAQLLTCLVDPSPTDKIFDACAAPGGKAFGLLEAGARQENLILCEAAHKRLKILGENIQRLGYRSLTVKHGDAAEVAAHDRYDKILLDAPCSAMGVIRRHPEIKWQRTSQDVVRSAEEQARLLNALSQRLTEKGELVYMVCSFEPEETIWQIQQFLKNHPEFSILPPHNRIHEFYRKYITRANELLIYTGNSDDLDGFYGVILKRG